MKECETTCHVIGGTKVNDPWNTRNRRKLKAAKFIKLPFELVNMRRLH